MKNILLIICLFLLTFNVIYAVENVDVIKLKDGTILKGEILETNDAFVIINTSLGEIKIERDNIEITPIIIYLKDDNIIKGNLINRNETSVNVETSLGSFEIKLENIKKMIEETNPSINSSTNLTTNTQNDTDIGIKAIGNAFLYQQRQKKISTALGLQALGAGLLYSEKYTMGTIMLLAENGLLISGAFVDDPEIVPYLWISGIVLKAINTFFTIKSVNDYNNKLASEMGISVDTNSREITFKTRKGYYYIAPSAGLGFGYESKFAYGATIGYGKDSIGRLGANYTLLFNDNHMCVRAENLTLQYEKPILIKSSIFLTPKFGLGFISSYYKDNGLLAEVHQSRGFGFIIGGDIEFNITDYLIIKTGYNWFICLEESKISNSAFLATFGFKL